MSKNKNIPNCQLCKERIDTVANVPFSITGVLAPPAIVISVVKALHIGCVIIVLPSNLYSHKDNFLCHLIQ